jgi:hypothetical protein
MPPIIIALAIMAGFSTLVFRLIISHRPLRISGSWTQIILSSILGVGLWIFSTLLTLANTPSYENKGWDLFCGILILMCVLWCNYWIGNLGGGFRVQMQITLADQTQPVSLEKWMEAFNGRGMRIFLADRLNSILIPGKIVEEKNGKVRLLPGWGMFYGRLMNLIKKILPNLRTL